jgi:hypothetical protein
MGSYFLSAIPDQENKKVGESGCLVVNTVVGDIFLSCLQS